MRATLFFFVWTLAALAQAPRILSASNRASLVPTGTPFYGIAPGSVCAITGSNLGPAERIEQNPEESPLATELGGVTVEVQAGGAAYSAFLYSVSPTVVVAVIPSATPPGKANLIVRYNGTAGSPFPVEVLATGFGIATTLETGTGNVSGRILSAEDAPLLALHTAANPGETISIEGTGLGATALEDNVIHEEAVDMPEVPIEVYFGSGVKAEVLYRGRGRWPGWDRLEVIVPEGVLGCYVALYTKTGDFVSNFVTVPVAPAGSRQCVDGRGYLAPDSPLRLSTEPLNIGSLSLGRVTIHIPALGGLLPAQSTANDAAGGTFLRYTPRAWLNYAGPGQPEQGGCIVIVAVAEGTFGEASRPEVSGFLDAGSALTLRSSTGVSIQIPKAGDIYAYGALPPVRPLFLPASADGSVWTFTGPGGKDIGAFEAQIRPNAPLRWTNRTTVALTTVDRRKGLEITWSGGGTDDDSYIVISGGSPQNSPRLTSNFLCTAKPSAGKFTVPAEVMASMVASSPNPGPISLPGGILQVSSYKYPGTFKAPGLDLGTLNFYTAEAAMVDYR